MMGVSELGWPLSSEQIDPNELVDKLLNEIILTASQKSVSPNVCPLRCVKSFAFYVLQIDSFEFCKSEFFRISFDCLHVS